MVFTHPLISKSSSPFTNPLVIVPRAPITIGITTFMFYCFFQFLRKGQVLIFLFAFFHFYSVFSRYSKVHNSASSLFLLLIITRSGHLAEIRGSIYIAKSQRSLCVSLSRTDAGLCIYHLFVW